MGARPRAWLQFGGFALALMVLLVLQRRFPALDHALGFVLLALFVAGGAYALVRATTRREPAAMPSFYGMLPRRWRRWVLGEEREAPRR